MSKYAIILTENTENKSVSCLRTALEKTFNVTGIQVLVLDSNDAFVSDGCLVAHMRSGMLLEKQLHLQIEIRIHEIAIIIKRTWTEKRYRCWKICEALLEYEVPVINSHLIPWTHSKIAQYRSMEHTAIFPKSICFDEQWMALYQSSVVEQETMISDVLSSVESLGYPLIIKISHGSRGTGVYRVSNADTLYHFLGDYLSNQIKTSEIMKKNGFIIQQFIPPVDSYDMSRSIYWRVNVVDQRISSILQFELGWEPFIQNGQQKAYERLHDNLEAPRDMPVTFNEAQTQWVQFVIEAIPYTLEVVGLDVMFDSTGHGILLEVNDGPAISLIEELGLQYAHTEAGQQCLNFSNDIAALACQKAIERPCANTQLSAKL